MWFGYDPLGRCVKRWVGPHVDGHVRRQIPTRPRRRIYYYDGWNLIQEGSSGSSADRVYVHGGRVDEIVASFRREGVWILSSLRRAGPLHAADECERGNPRSNTTMTPLVFRIFTRRWDSSSMRPGSPSGNRFLFTGREWLKDLQVYDYRARMYQPELGRFLQPDPTAFEAGDYNLYRYCHNDPVNKGDPTGLATDFMWDFARYGDSANTSQGTFAEFTHRAYMGDTGGGSRRYTMAGQYKVGPANGGDEANIETGRRILAQQSKEG